MLRFSYANRQNSLKESGEQPIFTTRAHVFVIDQASKKNWTPVSTQAVDVSFFFDGSRQTYRIISVDGVKAIINSTVTGSMTFTKTSQKFGQWTDARANTIYGLGFANEEDLNLFTEKFSEVRQLAAEVKGRGDSAATNSLKEEQAILSSPDSVSKHNHSKTNSVSSTSSDGDAGRVVGLPLSGASKEAQLQYENDRLKLALTQSSANTKKWEVELSTLRNNNARLTAALQESKTNVEEWKRQLAAYKEEILRLKRKLAESEGKSNAVLNSGNPELERELDQCRSQLAALKLEKDDANAECVELRNKLQLQKSSFAEKENLKQELSASRSEESRLRRDLAELSTRSQSQRTKLLQVLEQASARAVELVELQDTALASLQDGESENNYDAHR